MRLLFIFIALFWSTLVNAKVLNIEFEFAPYTGDISKNEVELVAWRVEVAVNNVPLFILEVPQEKAMVLFEERKISTPVLLSLDSFGPVVRSGKNTLQITFKPKESKPYQARLNWSLVTDKVTEKSESGHHTATNRSGQGSETKAARGQVVLTHEFTADTAQERPWHKYPPIATLSETDKQGLREFLSAWAAAFKPDFTTLQTFMDQDALFPSSRKQERLRLLKKAYDAGIRMEVQPADQLEFITTNNPEVVIRGRQGAIYKPQISAAVQERLKEDKDINGSLFLLSAIYRPQAVVVRQPNGTWMLAY